MHRALPALVVLVAGGVQLRFTWANLEYLFGLRQYFEEPVEVSDTLKVRDVRERARTAGIEMGDVLAKVDGRCTDSLYEAQRAFFDHRAGTPMTLDLERGGKTVTATVMPKELAGAASDKPMAVIINLITPWCCILLCALVAWRRPGEPLTHALTGLLLCLSQFLTAEGYIKAGYEPWWQWPSTWLGVFGSDGLPAAWLWFALLFPDPKSRHKLMPWTMWVLALPGALHAALMATIITAFTFQPNALSWLYWVSRVPRPVAALWFNGCLLLGFANFGYKLWREDRPAMRRRLQWMSLGLVAGLGPIGVLVARQILFEHVLNDYPLWVQLPAVFTPVLVPLTLAYAVLVDRVFDVGVFVRQGLLASKTVAAVRLLLRLALFGSAYLAFTRGGWPFWVRDTAAAGLMVAGVLAGKAADWLRRWVDRRFFQEAVNTEHLLVELSSEVRRIADPQALLRTVTDRLADALHLRTAAALVPANGGFVTAHAFGFGGKVSLERGHPALERMREHREAVAAGPRDLEGLGAELLLPLGTTENLLGILALGQKRSEEPYSRGDLRLLESVASQTALALENSRLTEAVAREVAQRERIRRELEIAREVQERLFPKAPPAVEGLELAGECRPAQTIGGDYYDFIETPAGEIGLAIGDIAGKGIPAALLMAALQASLRGLTLAGVTELADLMEKLNRLVFDATPANRFATFFHGLYEPRTRRLRYSSAGHNPVLLCRGGAGQVLWLKTVGVGLGLARRSRYAEAEIALEPGDVLLLYTDGLTEARNAAGEEFGEARLEAAVRGMRSRGAREISDGLLGEVSAFAGETPQHDDITLIVAKAG